ncbi:MAG: hypothetical protein MJE63_34190, partial [Proteobacteria bacterium]|nr:hypothetical protein [Pseudomonadota bacterium]
LTHQSFQQFLSTFGRFLVSLYKKMSAPDSQNWEQGNAFDLNFNGMSGEYQIDWFLIAFSGWLLAISL